MARTKYYDPVNDSNGAGDSLSDNYAARIQAARKARGWTQEDLGVALNVSKARISDVERGTVTPGPLWRAKAALALGLPAAELAPELAGLYGDGEPAAEITMVIDGSAKLPMPRWVPMSDDDTMRLAALDVRESPKVPRILAIIEAATRAGVSVRFRGDLPPAG